MEPTPIPFNAETLAERWGCSAGLVRKLCRTGQLNHFRVGSLYRMSLVHVLEFETRAQLPPQVNAQKASHAEPPTAQRAKPAVVAGFGPRIRKLKPIGPAFGKKG